MGTYTDRTTAQLAGKKKPRKLSSDEQSTLVKEVRDNVESAWEHERVNITDGIIDQRFRANDQWDDIVRAQREHDGRATLTFNRLNTFVNQVVNPIKQADKAIKAKPDDNSTNPMLAKICDGLFRKIQRQSMAHSVFGHQLECQAGCGIGWIRINHGYKDESSFEQEIYLEKIQNPFSVFWDPAARDPVRSDAMWMCVTEMMPEATFKSRWPKAALTSIDDPSTYMTGTGISQSGFIWRESKDIRVCEYYRKVPITKTLAKLATGETKDITDMPEQRLAMLPVIATREAQTHKVEKFMVSGSEVLEGPTDVPGCYIPIIPAIGGEVALDRGLYRFSVIRFARDGQRMYNLNRSAMAEWIGGSPKAPWLLTPGMISRTREMWDTQGLTNRNYLLWTPDKDNPNLRPERSQPPQAPVALSQDAQFAAEDMKYGANIHDASIGAKSQEVSGIALERKQMSSDVSNYHFGDNFKATLMHVGTIIMSWIPVIYDTPRTLQLVGADGTEHPTPVNTPIMDPQTGQMVIQNDLTTAKFNVDVTIGPSYDSRRSESSEQIGEFMKNIPPQQAAVITDIYARNQDWEGHEEIANRLKATIPPAILQGSQVGPDGQPMPPPPQPPDPMMVKQIEKITAEIEKIRADAALTIVQARELDHSVNLAQLPGIMDAEAQARMQPPDPTVPGPQAIQ